MNYSFANLAMVESAEAIAQDAAGRCFWSYTDFTASIGNRTTVDSVYIDHSSNPAFSTGWRGYLHESRTDLEVQVVGNEIQVVIPYALIGQPSAGDRIGEFRLQVSNSMDGLALTYQTDWLPDDSRPCDCWAYYPGP